MKLQNNDIITFLKILQDDMDHLLTSRGFEISNMRIDVTSNKDTMNKSFRVIAPNNMKETVAL